MSPNIYTQLKRYNSPVLYELEKLKKLSTDKFNEIDLQFNEIDNKILLINNSIININNVIYNLNNNISDLSLNKQNKLIAGFGISIDNETNTISATGEGGMTNPMTSLGDLIVGGVDGTPSRLAKGSEGQYLKVGSSSLEFGDAEVKDIKINNTSVVSSKVANIETESSYNASTNKIATMTDVNKKLSKYENDSSQWDTSPNNGSTKPITSGGLYNELLKYNRYETVYDMSSNDSSINWGYTSGIPNNTTVTGKDFSKYKYLLIYATSLYYNGIVAIPLNDLTSENLYTTRTIIGSYGSTNAVVFAGGNVNADKTSFQARIFLCVVTDMSNESAGSEWFISKIVGVY